MKTAREDSSTTTNPHAINVLLAYDTAGTCGAFLKMLDRISTRLRDKKLFNVKAFKFGLLEQIDPRKWAAASADETELAVVAFGEVGAPGADLLRWVENWAARHEGMNAALGLLPMGALPGKSVRRVVRALRDIATRHGLGFIYDAEGRFNLLQDAGTVVA